jgi:hypothetical protein
MLCRSIAFWQREHRNFAKMIDDHFGLRGSSEQPIDLTF